MAIYTTFVFKPFSNLMQKIQFDRMQVRYTFSPIFYVVAGFRDDKIDIHPHLNLLS